MGSSGTCFPDPAQSPMRSTARVWSLARATISARGENAFFTASHPMPATVSMPAPPSNTRLTRRIRFLFPLSRVVPQNGRERPDEAGADRLSAEPAEPEGEGDRAPHVRLELHGLQGHL